MSAQDETEVTLEQVRAQTLGVGPALLLRLARYANLRTEQVNPAEAMRTLGMDGGGPTARRYEGWWRRFCEETGRTYQPHQDSFTRHRGKYTNPKGVTR